MNYTRRVKKERKKRERKSRERKKRKERKNKEAFMSLALKYKNIKRL